MLLLLGVDVDVDADGGNYPSVFDCLLSFHNNQNSFLCFFKSTTVYSKQLKLIS